MQNASTDKKLIGRAEKLAFPELGFDDVAARIDTGARTSAIWASAEERDGVLEVVFYGESSPHYTAAVHRFDTFTKRVVASSNGQTEQRYVVRLLVVLGGKRIRSTFTLADRSTQVYPVLIGRNTLRGKFIVDVKQGDVLLEAEKKRINELQTQLHDNPKET